MKGTSLIVSIVLFIAVAVLYVLHFTGQGKNEHSSESAVVSEAGGLNIAYVKADSVIMNYILAEELHDEFTRNQESFTTDYGKKRQTFERDAAGFQEKLQRGGFLSEQSAVRERDRLLGIEQEIQKMDQDLSTRLGEMQGTNNQRVLDSLMNTLKGFNATKKYDYILNGANVLIGNEGHNITAEILKRMNEKYEGSVKK